MENMFFCRQARSWVHKSQEGTMLTSTLNRLFRQLLETQPYEVQTLASKGTQPGGFGVLGFYCLGAQGFRVRGPSLKLQANKEILVQSECSGCRVWGDYPIVGCQNYSPFLGTLNIYRCRTIIGIQKGTMILTTTHRTLY